MAAPTRNPIYPVIAITKNDASLYNFNPFTSVFDFRVQELQVKPPVDSKGGTFTLKCTGSSANNTTTNTLLNNIKPGNQISFNLGKSNTTLTKVMLGVIEDITISEPNKNSMFVTLVGVDWGSFILKNRIVQWAWYQRKATDGVSLDKTDTTTNVSNLTSDLLTTLKVYPFNDFTAADEGVVFNSANVDPMVGSVQLPQFLANFEHLEDKLSELDAWSAGLHYIDPNKNYIVKPVLQAPDPAQAWLFTDDVNDSNITLWPSGKVGYIGVGIDYKYTIENYKRRIIGIGGDQLQIDPNISQESNTTSDVLHTGGNNQWLAIQFTPKYVTATSIFIYVGQVGIPTLNLSAQLVMDGGNDTPTGQVIRQLSKDYQSISVSPGGWISFQIGDEYLVGNKYWLVLQGTGSDSNTFRWYKGTGLPSSPSYKTSTSSDGITWAAATSNSGYLIRGYYSRPLISALPGAGITATDKGFKEEVYRKPFIYDVNSMNSYLQTISSVTNFKKELLTGMVYAPDTIPTPFSTALVRLTQSGLQITGTSNYYILTDITYNFRGGEEGATGEFWLQFTAARFTAYP